MSSERAASTFNHWIISPASGLLLFFFFLKILFLTVCMCVSVSGGHICGYLWKSELLNPLEPESQAVTSCLTWPWEVNPSPLEEQYTLTAELSLQHPAFFFLQVRCCSPNTVPPERGQFSLWSIGYLSGIWALPSSLALCSLETMVCFLPAALHLDQESLNFHYQGSRVEISIPFLPAGLRLLCKSVHLLPKDQASLSKTYVRVFAFMKPQSFLFTLLLGQGTPT